ncbi:hypothetical protein PLESTB_000491700 [Pleodorina starrii]|uniref:Uncharacterized protein n=1 Tax=Pleodorina starrii TaxID=330485 RepID=A0A9W6BGH4_9CHLO|nr:hypothetical protein PLESTM_000363200 [Pleodorina starrii]GLC51338.1 hypothetical protein PLESTB_000491700 [Pleodorina starrii]GLC63703.1 hypothetical protein PLESTF_000065200 [Pleodorina starrii]
MIDLTLSSEDESPPKRRCGSQQQPQQRNQHNSQPQGAAQAGPAAAPWPVGPAVGNLPAVGVLTNARSADEPEPKPQVAQPLNPPAFRGVDDLLFGADNDEDNNDGDFDFAGGVREDADAGGHGEPVAGGDGGEAGQGRKPGGRRKKPEVEEDWEPGCSGSDGEPELAGGARKKRGGGGGKRLTAEERAERERAKLEEKAAKAAERARAKEEKERAKAAEKERKAAEKDQQKRAKVAQKEAVKGLKEADHALKCTMVGRYTRLLLSNSLAASPLGMRLVELIPVVRGNKQDETFPHETHKDMPLAARGYKYCMWGVRLPAAAAARLQAAEGCALEASELPDPTGKGLPLMLFPAVLLVLSGDELLVRLESEPAAPLAGLYGDVTRAHPGATLLVYVVGLPEALRRRERANRSFSRMAVEDLLFDVAVGMPAVRLQYDCPESDLARAATDILNLGYAMSQQPKKRLEAYLNTFGSRTTVPLRSIKEVLGQQGGAEQLTLCEALSQLVAPQRAAAVAAEYPSMAALIEALRARPEGKPRENMFARCRIPGVVAGKGRQQVAGPAASMNLAQFLLTQNGREEWKGSED